MRLGLFSRSGRPAPSATELADSANIPAAPVAETDPEKDYRARVAAIRETIDMLEADLSAMIRDVHRTSDAVRAGIQSSSQALTSIRENSETLAEKTTGVKDDAIKLATATEEFANSGQEILRQVREAGELADRATKAAQAASLVHRRAEILVRRNRTGHRADRIDCQANQSSRIERDDRSGARGRSRPRLRGRRQRGQGIVVADPESDRRDHQQDRIAAAQCRAVDHRAGRRCAGDRDHPPGLFIGRDIGRSAAGRDHRTRAHRDRNLAIHRQCRRRRQGHRPDRGRGDRTFSDSIDQSGKEAASHRREIAHPLRDAAAADRIRRPPPSRSPALRPESETASRHDRDRGPYGRSVRRRHAGARDPAPRTFRSARSSTAISTPSATMWCAWSTARISACICKASR